MQKGTACDDLRPKRLHRLIHFVACETDRHRAVASNAARSSGEGRLTIRRLRAHITPHKYKQLWSSPGRLVVTAGRALLAAGSARSADPLRANRGANRTVVQNQNSTLQLARKELKRLAEL
jgi:hypothetical protein